VDLPLFPYRTGLSGGRVEQHGPPQNHHMIPAPDLAA
jgi:hypothetical protein